LSLKTAGFKCLDLLFKLRPKGLQIPVRLSSLGYQHLSSLEEIIACDETVILRDPQLHLTDLQAIRMTPVPGLRIRVLINGIFRDGGLLHQFIKELKSLLVRCREVLVIKHEDRADPAPQ
jgi:hypothetical protein